MLRIIANKIENKNYFLLNAYDIYQELNIKITFDTWIDIIIQEHNLIEDIDFSIYDKSEYIFSQYTIFEVFKDCTFLEKFNEKVAEIKFLEKLKIVLNQINIDLPDNYSPTGFSPKKDDYENIGFAINEIFANIEPKNGKERRFCVGI